jgi:hypothetical protein
VQYMFHFCLCALLWFFKSFDLEFNLKINIVAVASYTP